MKSLKLLVVTLSIAMLMAVSACASPPPPTPVPTPMPMLTEEEAEKSVVHYMVWQMDLANRPAFLMDYCFDDDWKQDDFTAVQASYHESGKWKVNIGPCVFVVDDYTGKVTGP